MSATTQSSRMASADGCVLDAAACVILTKQRITKRYWVSLWLGANLIEYSSNSIELLYGW